MKKRTVLLIAVVVVVIVAVGVLFYVQVGQFRTRTEKLENGYVGVETTIKRSCDGENFLFTGSAAFLVEQDQATGQYGITDVTAPFLERKKASDWYTFSSIGAVETQCQEEGIRYTIQRTLQVRKNGEDVTVITIGLPFTLDPATGKITAEPMDA